MLCNNNEFICIEIHELSYTFVHVLTDGLATKFEMSQFWCRMSC